MNWVVKIAAKLVLSRVPASYKAFSKLGIFRHGQMNEVEYAAGVFFKHFERLGGESSFAGKTTLELGPGDSLASAVMSHAVGASKCYLVDAGNFATASIEFYVQLAESLRNRGYAAADLAGSSSVDDVLERTNAVYLTSGVASLSAIADKSVDIIWSHAVLEHIRVHEVSELLRELRRIAADSARMSHQIDYKDHLGGSLNNLRFPSKMWEAELMARSGFYTNRIRNSEFLRLIEDAGFSIMHAEPSLWDATPIARGKLAKEFRNLSEIDLRTKGVEVIATA
jgi:hypothetical protein